MRIEAGDVPDRRAPLAQAVPQGLHADPDRRDGADAGDDDSSLISMLPLVLLSSSRRRRCSHRGFFYVRAIPASVRDAMP